MQHIRIEKYDWSVKVFYAISSYDTDRIINELEDLGCKTEYIVEAEKLLDSAKLNVGLTYSNIYKRQTVIVIALTSSSAEFLNSLVHETAHLSQHIGETYLLDPYGEEVCYIQGDLMLQMYDKCKDMLCEHCRKKKNP